MIVRCTDCLNEFDDTVATTVCPHGRFISDEDAARKDAAAKLLGKKIFVKGAGSMPYEITSIDARGYVTLRHREGKEDPKDLWPIGL